MNVNEWKDRLKAKVDGEGPLPAPGVSWGALEAGITGIERRRKVRRWTGAAVVVAAVITCIALVLPWSHSGTDVAAPIVAESEPQQIDAVEIVKENPMDESFRVMADVHPVRKLIPEQTKEILIPETVIDNDVETAADEHKNLAESHDVEIHSEETLPSEKKPDSIGTYNYNAYQTELEIDNNRKSKRGRLSIGLGSGFSAGAGDDYSYPPTYSTPGGIFVDPTMPSTPPKESITLEFPITIGISAKYAFNERIFILGGLSAKTCHAKSSYYLDELRLWYLGPSAGIGVNLYQNANFSAYTAATGNLDWCVSRRDLPMLPSMILSAGIQSRLGGITWFYAEPQLKYTFKSENSAAKVSFENPVQFALSVGLRFDL